MPRIIQPRIAAATPGGVALGESAIRSGVFTVRKWRENQDPAGSDPFEVESFHNAYVNTGVILLNLAVGAGGTPFNAANAYIGVGASTAAVVATQTDLQASSDKLRVGMVSGWPLLTGQIMSWKASFGSGQANFPWNEFALFNAVSAGVMLNRVVQPQGTKAGGAWEITFTITVP